MTKLEKIKKELEKVRKNQSLGHNFYVGKPIQRVIDQLEFEIRTRERYGNDAREAFIR